ncbi:unnamed protein product [Haemonchus placei]|uniref:Reverse transcriptase domain-containing protein n=1 Tax=Haemonchus placei TaxID=6290 RepID=A0A0N4W7H5_HAEPC|nr:unnamed protein product [Haemonchus placei]
MIRLQESERDATRFLWLKDTTKSPNPENIRELRFTRVPFGTKTSPSLLAMSIKFMLEKNSNRTVRKEIARNLYVDNMILSAASEEEAKSKYLLSKKIFDDMSMNLREFATNSAQLQACIPEKDRGSATVIKLLGIFWDRTKGHLLIRSQLEFESNPTKRSILRTIHSNFDPLGFLISLLIPAQIFLQSLWAKGYEWDEELSDQDIERWKSTCMEASTFSKRLHRSIYVSDPEEKLELCTFADASINAYATCCYLRKIHDNSIDTDLICARYRLAPISYLTERKTMTIPELELLALFIVTQLTDFILNELDLFKSEQFASSRTVTLHYRNFFRVKMRALS